MPIDKLDIKPYKPGRKEVWTNRCRCGFFMPNGYELCDNCLLARFNLQPRHDSCDQIGLGPRSIDEDMVVAALRAAIDGQR